MDETIPKQIYRIEMSVELGTSTIRPRYRAILPPHQVLTFLTLTSPSTAYWLWDSTSQKYKNIKLGSINYIYI